LVGLGYAGWSFGKLLAVAQGVDLGPDCRDLRFRSHRRTQRLKNDFIADLADPDLGALEAAFLGQVHGLVAAIHKKLRDFTHDPSP
jgi:hypothetical protein